MQKKKILFRLHQSEEKLRLSTLMLQKSAFNDSVIYSYLSIFYSVRILLIEKDEDSDDYNKIYELIENYFNPTGWTGLPISEIIKEAKQFKEKIDANPGIRITKKEAEKLNKNASLILEEIKSKLQI
ncbi:MAG: HEPN domain-containing protein [Spirochaetes bacterium]|nr:HEPN domain-containing protein [Spirochaetota bacterium]